jgi:tetratricopeptide (TPR) repeat protein
MDAVTYPNENVDNFINNNVIAVRLPSDHEPLSSEKGVKWTPALILLDHNGKEHHRTIGFLSAEELVPSILLGIGNMHFNNNQFQEALGCYEKIIQQFPLSDSTPEAIFQTGVSRYKNSGNPQPLKEAYLKLKEDHPSSQWEKRAYPYRLIQ